MVRPKLLSPQGRSLILLGLPLFITACLRFSGYVNTPIDVTKVTTTTSPSPTPNPSCASFAFTGMSTLGISTIAPDNPRVGESTILQLTGTFPETSTTFEYSAPSGTISGTGARINYTAAATSDAAGTVVPITATATCGTKKISKTVSVTVGTALPRLNAPTVTLDIGTGYYDATGTISYATTPANYTVVATIHSSDYYYKTYAAVQSDGSFAFRAANSNEINTFNSNTDRITFMLVSNSLDLTTVCTGDDPDRLCNDYAADTYALSFTKKSLPFAMDGSSVLDFSVYYFDPVVTTNSDSQLQNLINRFSKNTVSTSASGGTVASPAYLIRSYLDLDEFYLYDQALAVIAFSKAGLNTSAQKVLNALVNTQMPSGAWYFSYFFDGSSPYNNTTDASTGDWRIAGSIAWVVMAINAYQKATNDTSYTSMATAALNYLATQLDTLTINGQSVRAVRYGPTALTGTAFDWTKTYSLEHNLDAYSAFKVFVANNPSDGNAATYTSIATDLKSFLTSHWNSNNFFYPGYSTSGTPGFNTAEWYMDTQTWSILALGVTGPNGEDYTQGLTWNCNHFSETAGFINGGNAGLVGFFDYLVANSAPTYSFVWSEGTLGAIAAMDAMKTATGTTFSCTINGRILKRADYLASMNNMSFTDGGTTYSSWGQNLDFIQSSSVAGTAWLYFVNHSINPFQP